MSIFDPTYIDRQTDTKLKSLILNRLDKDKFDELSSHSSDEIWFIQESELSGQPIVVDTRPGPTKLSQFENDVPYLSVISWYDIQDRPSIPYLTSQLTNDSGYATSSYVQQQVMSFNTKWRDWYVQEGPQIDYSDKPLTIVARTAGTTVGIVQDYDPIWSTPGPAPTISLQYSTDDGSTWNAFTVGSTTITLSKGGTVQFKATTTNAAMDTENCLRFNRFDIVGSVDVRGNPQSLLDGTDFISISTLTNGQLGQIFRGQPVVDASNMVITAPTADSHSCSHMFRGSTTLKHGPDLRSTTLGSTYTYDGFFNGCTSLETIRIHYTGNFSPASVFDGWVASVPATGTFYYDGTDTTRGNSAIPTGWIVQPLPHVVNYVDYINTNIAEMDTGVVPTTTTKVVGRFRGSAVGNWFVGTEGQGWRGFNSQNTFFVDVNGMGARISQSGWDTTKWYDVEIGNFYFTCTPVDGGTTISQTDSSQSFTHTNPLKLGSATYQWAGEYEQFDCAGFKIYDGDTLVKDYKPALDDNNVACFYEELSGVYEYPSSGTFIAHMYDE